MDGVSGSGDNTGGLCRVGGTPIVTGSVYQMTDGIACPTEDIITTAADCEATIGELDAISSFTYEEDNDSARHPGCRWVGTIVYFNSDLNGESTEAGESGLCRVGGTSSTVYL
jgi:hypothetical protein